MLRVLTTLFFLVTHTAFFVAFYCAAMLAYKSGLFKNKR